MRILLGALAAWLSLSGPGIAQTAEQATEIARAERIGRELYEHDQAAWHGTDAMLAELSDSEKGRLSGWITERQGDAIALLFVGGEAGARGARYCALYRAGEIVEHGSSDAPLTARQERLLLARDIAVRAPVASCSNRYNSVTLPREQEGADGIDVDVYLMPGSTDANVVMVGGYYRIGVDVDAGAIVETQAFSNSCLQLGLMQGVAGAVFTHLVTDTPTETHVFISLTQGIPLFVMIAGNLWTVKDGRIALERTR